MTSASPAPDTRARIIGAASGAVLVEGYGSTSIADILGRAEINSGSLYYFSRASRDLLVAVLEEYRDGIGPMLLDPVWEASTIRSRGSSLCWRNIAS